MTEETKKLITAEMLSDITGDSFTSVYISPNCSFIEAQSAMVDKRMTVCELKNKLKSYLVKTHGLMKQYITDTRCDSGLISILINVRGKDEIESLLKLYHAAKAAQ